MRSGNSDDPVQPDLKTSTVVVESAAAAGPTAYGMAVREVGSGCSFGLYAS